LRGKNNAFAGLVEGTRSEWLKRVWTAEEMKGMKNSNQEEFICRGDFGQTQTDNDGSIG
jgi:hypothetical protein